MYELGELKLVRRLGRGSLAEVFLATTPDEHTVVVKKLLDDWRHDAARALMLLEEGELLLRLSHPGLRRCLGVSHDPPAQILEHLDGATLQDMLGILRKDGVRIPWRYALDIARHVNDTLTYLHAQGVCHLDVGPDNVLVIDKNRVVLTDLARGLWPGRRTRIAYEPIPQKLGYCAPELWRREPLSAPTDVYQLGCLLWEMLAGQPPAFVRPPQPGHELPALLPLTTVWPEAPAPVIELVAWLTQRAVAARPRSADIVFPVGASPRLQ